MSAPSPASDADARALRPRWTRLRLDSRRGAPSRKPAEEMGQPQDGAVILEMDAKPEAKAPSRGASARDLREPEDARLTGGTRSLMRRVLGLNVTQPALTSLRALPAWARKPALQ